MHYYFDKHIDVETVNELIKTISTEGSVKLFFSTEGGETSAMYVLLDFLNSKDNVEVVLTDFISSAGTFILTEYTGKLSFNEKLDGFMFHMSDRESYRLRKNYVDYSVLAEQDLERNKKFVKKLKDKGYLTEKQIKNFLKGKDVFVYKRQFDKWKINNKYE